MKNLSITQADTFDLDSIVVLFEEYRKFYKAEADPKKAADFIKNRIINNESIIFLAKEQNSTIGFVQLYPAFSSVSMTKIFILNDLFVAASSRGKGVATALIQAAIKFAKDSGCSRVSLSTARDNTARKLYESLGFKESGFKFYNYILDS